MIEEENENFSDIVNEDDYELMQSTIGISPLDMMASHSIAESDDLSMDPMMLNMMNADETLRLEEYGFMQDTNYLATYHHPFPPSEPKELCNTDYSGPHNFEVFVDPNVLKNPWEYSTMLNKIYIDMKHKFPINFSVKNESLDQLYVRVMPMFAEDRYFQELVFRCICHEQLQDSTNQDVSELVAQHIIRCDNNKAQYFGDKNSGKRLSIVIPLSSPQPGTDSVKEFFYFVCKNSCVGGMNRRPIQVIFTLENYNGTVLGRRVLCVRICSCPKRDREKEEAKREKHENPPVKKRKAERKLPPSTDTVDRKLPPSPDAVDRRSYQLNVNIVGEENYKHVLKICHGLMSSEILKLDGKNGNDAPFRKCLDEVNVLMNRFSE